ncbi:peptidylprolyl isomerase [bacterium]|nr:peptidylprolyl isomerase [bacterium]
MNNYSKIALATLLLGTTLQFACTQAPKDIKKPENPQVKVSQGQEETGELPCQDKLISCESKGYRSLVPYEDQKANAPKIDQYYLARFETTEGDIDIEIYPQAAPNAARRFVTLIDKGFYNDIPIFRVVKHPQPFVAQFGINWRKGLIDWRDKNFNDDPCIFKLEPGTLAFAKAGPNTNSTQVFINYINTDPLRSQNFTTFAKVVKGFENTDKFKSVGDPAMGLDQGALWNYGESYLESLPSDQKPTMIKKAYLIGNDTTPKAEEKK